MAETKITVEEASEMSLEDYISAKGIVDISRKYNRKCKGQRQTFNGEIKDLMSIDCSDEINDDSLPNASSLQWRLKDPNRPIGMPPLVPKNATVFKRYNHRRPYRTTPYCDRDAPPWTSGMNRNQQNFKPQMKKQLNMSNNGVNINKQSHPPLLSNQSSDDLVPNSTSNVVATLNNFTQMFTNTAGCMDLAKMLIDKFDEVRQSRNQPKYDMILQKEISEIQGKALFFTCGSGAPCVISHDGEGIDDCKVKVSTTDVSMNQRFS